MADARQVSDWLGKDWAELYFELHVQTLGGVEMFIARQGGRKASLVVDGRQLTGRHVIPVPTSPMSWHDQARLDEMHLMIWNRVFHEERRTPLTTEDLKTLKAELLTRRTKGRDPAHYCVAVRLESDRDAGYQKNVDQFLASLEIPTVCYGLQGEAPAFNGIEANVMSAVRNFLETFGNYSITP